MDEVVANKHIPVLIAPDKGTRGTPKRWLTSGRAAWKVRESCLALGSPSHSTQEQ